MSRLVDLTPFFQAVLGVIAVAITTFVLPWLQKKLNAEKLAELARWVQIAVTAAEQIYKGSGRGAEKKAYVLQFLRDKGYELDSGALAGQVNAMIEAAVWGLGN